MNLPDVRPAVRALTDDTIALRRDLHRHAELSTEEHRTQGVILERLRAIGAEDVRPCADTGATGLVRGTLPGPNVLWRADIDALPLQEETGLPFACDGAKAMHACGHDGHVAIALAIASVLQQSRASLAGTVRFAFQPAEEHVGGARRMIDEGIMSSPPVDRVFGFHIWAPARVGQAVVTAGPVFAASTHFRIIIRGQGGHASAPHTAVDPIVVAAYAVVALQTVVSRAVNPEETAVLTIGRIQGGVRGNIIPNEVMMSGTVRTFEHAVQERVLERATQILTGVTSAWGATFQFDTSTLPAVVNDPACAALAAGVGRGIPWCRERGRGPHDGRRRHGVLLGAGTRRLHHARRLEPGAGPGLAPSPPEVRLRRAEPASGRRAGLADHRGGNRLHAGMTTGRPVVIADYDPGWPQRFEAECDLIVRTCGVGAFVRVEHVGSTSVPGLAAKPVIDMMPGLRSLDDAPTLVPLLESIGYEYVQAFEHDTSSGPGMPLRRYFRKDDNGARAYHLHAVEVGSPFWVEHLLFRDYLRAHPDAAGEYARLKRQLAAAFNAALTATSDINVGYTDRKTEFIESIKARARAEAP